MPSIFPGMDPYLEGAATWPDLHTSLIAAIKRHLQPLLLPAYFASAEERLYIEQAQHSIYPDVALFKKPDLRGHSGPLTLVADEPAVVNWDYRHKEHFVEIRSAGTKEVISVIEVISPSNKSPGANGRELYLRKQQEILDSPVHLIEIDLLRQGAGTVAAAPGRLLALGHYDYLVCVSRGDRRGESEVYPSCMQNRLPRPRIPLRSPDADVVLDLPAIFAECYDEGAYEVRIDYTLRPPGALHPEDGAWLQAALEEAGMHK